MEKSTTGTNRVCKECGCDISSLYKNVKRCPECNKYYRRRLRMLYYEGKKREIACIMCGADISYLHGNRKYCYTCAKSAEAEVFRKKAHRYRMEGKILGTGFLGPHRNEDFDAELKEIKREKKRLGLENGDY
jgi:hypothetical protein